MAVSFSSAVNSAVGAPATSSGGPSVAQNFGAFLQLLTTQLRNQNPLEPLDTNQFTQQLVQFAQVEQQMRMNGSLEQMITLQKTAQTSAAVGFLGATVRFDGDTTRFDGKSAVWNFASERAGTASITVRNPAGETVYTENRIISAGDQEFKWNGTTTGGTTAPAGNYKVSIVALDPSGRPVSISSEVDGVVDGVDLTQNPPVLKVGGQTFTLDKIRQVRRTTT
ncbi:MAG: flagellar basal-body rod modification protein FlgD [Variibacter sp.]|jgi:flagellar basal-body rod modification protein FlgD|nr:flagellar basal-body rod modification protein FlgD [Variibacter sp.]